MLNLMEAGGVQLRAYRFALDPTAAQLNALHRHAGAARWAYNHALAAKRLAHQQRSAAIRELVDAGVDQADARQQVAIKIPGKAAIQKAWNQIKGDTRTDADPRPVAPPPVGLLIVLLKVG